MGIQRNDLEFYDLSAAEWWDENAKIYALNSLNPARFAFFDRYLTLGSGCKVLDVGCGGGFSCEFLARRGAIVSGVDQSAPCIESAKAHALESGLTIDYQQSVAEILPFDSEQFDCVVCVDVLEHVADLSAVIQEIQRVLKPNGLFFFDTVNRTFKSKLMMIWLLEDLLQEIPRGIHDWHKFIKPEELSTLMQQVGFAEIEMQGFNLFGRSIFEQIRAYRYYRKTKQFQISISSDLSLSYIGKAVKLNSHA
ncbi:MAG TPA: bifunctional 2-polyprenyl-6-hydroxyphenol methylase/3-demethylubiquinol 3-O-methyltransferase UbiG [Thermosynechococcaceae cyanobacterium]